jgi:hypothetical protein
VDNDDKDETAVAQRGDLFQQCRHKIALAV